VGKVGHVFVTRHESALKKPNMPNNQEDQLQNKSCVYGTLSYNSNIWQPSF